MTHASDTSKLSPDQATCHAALFETTWPQESTAVVAAHGELDAANGNQFVAYALRNSDQTQWMIVDLSGLTFFATAGFSALHTLNVQCVREKIRWALVPSAAVERVMRICDPDGTLPVCLDITGALTAVHEDPPRLLQLIPESR